MKDDILDINQRIIPLNAPESSFLIEGDIIKPKKLSTFLRVDQKWPKEEKVVPIAYSLSPDYDRASEKTLMEAFAVFEAQTCIRFVTRTTERDFISIGPIRGCYSFVGRAGGMQPVSLVQECLKKGKGVALHEIMHVLGFWHEHSREDRDLYINITWSEIKPGYEPNFYKYTTSNTLVSYDYESILHYGRYAFSRSGLPTITTEHYYSTNMGQRLSLSASDILRINKYYNCPQYQPAKGLEYEDDPGTVMTLSSNISSITRENSNIIPSDISRKTSTVSINSLLVGSAEHPLEPPVVFTTNGISLPVASVEGSPRPPADPMLRTITLHAMSPETEYLALIESNHMVSLKSTIAAKIGLQRSKTATQKVPNDQVVNTKLEIVGPILLSLETDNDSISSPTILTPEQLAIFIKIPTTRTINLPKLESEESVTTFQAASATQFLNPRNVRPKDSLIVSKQNHYNCTSNQPKVGLRDN
ncbi:astacin-like metalloendopeptidase isoform X2 [Rhinatrema bivittatum]|nr:astacin-like metalloendopeptidase isoform X2 [Rhinatrema bivittatum]XP_029460311.1 astacin-like metalloendopeptidase isoform X2 [Rhinatrema bivittatum]